MAIEISFGLLLAGKGKAWADDFDFEEVGEDVAVTDLKGKIREMPEEPVNLGFEDLG